MGKDNQPKIRQAAKLARKKAQRASYDRVLIISEGSKTEPNYFGEIRSAYRLHTANVQVCASEGTNPLQVVEFAEQLFLKGDAKKQIQPRAFEKVFAVFDRDDHHSYHNALGKALALNGRYRNDLGAPVEFSSAPSVPCFELWLLLHFEDVHAPMHREEVYQRLKNYIPDYEKGNAGYFEKTKEHVDLAFQRAGQLAAHGNPHDGSSYTDIAGLVRMLISLKD